MSLALVAYGSSDEESESSDVDEQSNEKSEISNGTGTAMSMTVSVVSGSGSATSCASQAVDLQSSTPVATSNSRPSNSANTIVNSSSLLALPQDKVTNPGGRNVENGTVDNFDDTKDSYGHISDEEDSQHPTDAPGHATLSGHISDEEDIGPGPAKFSMSRLPAPKNQQAEDAEFSLLFPTPGAVKKTEKVLEESMPLLSGLPAPKSQSSVSVTLQGYEEDEVEEEYKKKPETSEVPLKRKKQPVKISIPSLAELGSDDEDDAHLKKKPRPAGGGLSGLLSMLPNPKHMTVKEKGRALIPHTLTKRPVLKPSSAVKPKAPAKAPVVSSTGAKKLTGIPDSDSDDDEEESVNFFSFGGNELPATASTSTDITDDSLRTASSLYPKIQSTTSLLPPAGANVHPLKSTSAFIANTNTEDKTLVSSSRNVPSFSDSFNALRGPYSSGSQQGSDFSASTSVTQYNTQYGTAHAEEEQNVGYSEFTPQPYQDNTSYQANMQQMAQDQQFQRMVGKKFRGESMNIIDVNADDQMNKDDLTKNLTEEVAGFSYSKKKNKDMPSSTQRRKHQITYLAYQAKERELELKNQWAQNKQTKRQTQAKYGF